MHTLRWCGTAVLSGGRKRVPGVAGALIAAALVGCHGNGPRGAQADSVYAVAYGFILEYRTHFFPAPAQEVCLEGPNAPWVARRMHAHYLPIRVACEYEAAGEIPSKWSSDPTHVVSLAIGDSVAAWYGFFMASPNPFSVSYEEDGVTKWRDESKVRVLWRRLRARPYEVAIHVRYSDRRVQEADFDCLLYRSSQGWKVQQCMLSRVEWRKQGEFSREGIVGCWQLDWLPLHGEETEGLPYKAYLSGELDTLGSVRGDYRVLSTSEGPDSDWVTWDWGEHWRMGGEGGWRWLMTEEGIVALRAGGGYEGIEGTLVLEPETGKLRGVAVQWDDVGRPQLSDPMWRIVGQSVQCRVP